MSMRFLLALFIVCCAPRGLVKIGARCTSTSECVAASACIDDVCARVECTSDAQCASGSCDTSSYRCVGGGETTPTVFSFAARDLSVALASGQSVTTAFAITRTSNANAEATFTVSGLPQNVNGTITPTSGDTATLALAATPGDSAGAYTVTVSASINGVTQTASFTLALTKHVVLSFRQEHRGPPAEAVRVLHDGVVLQTNAAGDVGFDVTTLAYDFTVFFTWATPSHTYYRMAYVRGATRDALLLLLPNMATNSAVATVTSAVCAPKPAGATNALHALSSDQIGVVSASSANANCDVVVSASHFPDQGAGAETIRATKYALYFASTGLSLSSFALGSTLLAPFAFGPVNAPDITLTAIPALNRSVVLSLPAGMTSSAATAAMFDHRRSARLVDFDAATSFDLDAPLRAPQLSTRLDVIATQASAASGLFRFIDESTNNPLPLIFDTPPALATPAPNAALAAGAAFSWERKDNTISLLEINADSFATHWYAYCYSAEPSCQLPDLTPHPELANWDITTRPQAGDTLVWRVIAQDATSVDAMLTAANQVIGSGPLDPAIDTRWWRTEMRTLTH